MNKIDRLLQKELGDLFQKQTQAMHGVLVSVTAVRVKIPDLTFFIDDSLDYIENIDKLLKQ